MNKPTIWVVQCPMKKSGFPSLGSFGVRIEPLVIMHMETWKRLLEAHPTLKTQEFNVGTQD